jgi:hypothetical protein
MKLAIATAAVLACLFAAYFLSPSQSYSPSKRTIMLSNSKQCAVALEMYAGDHDGMLPSARNWSDAAMPYLRTEGLFSQQTPRGGWTSVAMNWSVGGTEIKQVVSPEETVLLFEAEGKRAGATGTVADLWTGYEGKSIYCSFELACKNIPVPELQALRWDVNGGPSD